MSDMMEMQPLKIGVVFWDLGEGLAGEASRSFSELGHEVTEFLSEEKLPENLDVIFAYGPFGSMVPLANQLLEIPKASRPIFIFWQIEPLPNPLLPNWLAASLGKFRSKAERLAYERNVENEWHLMSRRRWVTTRGYRFRYCGDLLWMQSQGILTLLVNGSPTNGAYLRELGLDPYRPPSPSYREGWGADLKLERDVPVLWLGKSATRRRKRNIQRVRRDLDELGIELLVVDGFENPYIFGEARTRLLNRTCIVLNLLRKQWDSNAARFQLAALNHALVVSEPLQHHTGFTPGEHFVEAPVTDLARTIQYYLNNDQERQQVANRAYELIKQTPRKQVYAQLLEKALRVNEKSAPY